jgi:hypothetical protein
MGLSLGRIGYGIKHDELPLAYASRLALDYGSFS